MSEAGIGVENLEGNKFGKEWNKLEPPVVGVVGAIDDSGEDAEENRIGLSAKQLHNLDLKRKQEIADAKSWLSRAALRNTEGLTGDTDYGMVRIVYEGNQAYAQVYNAFGKLSVGIGGPGVRISSKLANELGLVEGNEISISKPKSILEAADVATPGK